MRPTSKIALSWRVISYILLQIIINMLKNEHKSCFAWCSLSTAFIFEVQNSIRIKKQKGNCFLMTLDSFSTHAVSQNKDVLKMGVSPFERNKKKTVSNHVPNIQKPYNIGMIETLELLE